jgi:hypothetical protein
MAIPSKDFNAPADSEIDVDSPGNETLLTKIRDSLINLEERMGKNYTGAVDHDHDGVNSKSVVGIAAGSITNTEMADNAIGQAEMISGAIGQAELKTSLGSVSVANTIMITNTLPGGQFGFYPQIKMSATSTVGWFAQITNSVPGWTSYATRISMQVGAGGPTIYAQQRYITASAPYNLGNGDIPIFVFAIVDNITGKVIATYTADTPPWVYNGRPRNTFDSKKYKRKAKTIDKKSGEVLTWEKNFFYDRPSLLPDKATDFEAYLEAVAVPQYEEIEITPAMKNLDMDIIPHPFTGNDLTGKSVVLLDPVGSMAEKMRDLHDMGENVADLLHGRYLLIDNEDAGAISPVGVKTHKVKWK